MVEPSLFPRQVTPEEHVRKQSADTELFGRISKSVNNIAASLRILEERYSTLRNKNQVSEQNIIELEKEVTNDIKLLSEDMVELKRELADVKEKLRLISAEMEKLVNKNEFRIMERYLDMWQPMNFVTKDELNRLLEERNKNNKQQA
jgi:seryl-tRNA synthetase